MARQGANVQRFPRLRPRLFASPKSVLSPPADAREIGEKGVGTPMAIFKGDHAIAINY
jgi:hypothetical protein